MSGIRKFGNTVSNISDKNQRDLVLDTSRSFIVQAPAGSGKTRLLVHRYLVLLAQVTAPENIVAITFTKKATAEMRNRILAALFNPQGEDSDLFDLSEHVLENDKKLEWNLAENPSRLRIQTIDAFAYEMVRRMPWSSRFGGTPELLEPGVARNLYREASRLALEHIEQNDEWSEHCANIIKLADANFPRSQQLLAAMLEKRDRWMRGIGIESREALEGMWQELIEQQLSHATDSLPEDLQTEIAALAKFAAENPYEKNPNEDIGSCIELEGFPASLCDALPQWRGLEAILLTSKKELRQKITVTIGFPKNFTEQKIRLEAVINTLVDFPEFVEAISIVSDLPSGNFSDTQWQTLQSLLAVLRLAVAKLHVLFTESNLADYIEITQRAESALGEPEQPSELALSTDHQIQHILMDEVQDTSSAHIALLEKLIRGWQADEGKTLFFVGDPMQSIYRFREAEVGNFLEIQKNGLGSIKPESITLQSNFRSSKFLVEWFNKIFSEVFPKENDVSESAVAYVESTTAFKSSLTNDVTLNPYFEDGDQSEADKIIDQISDELKINPQTTIGVLGRSRNALYEIADSLREHGRPYQAIELDDLSKRPAIQDLMSLTRGLIQLSDRIAWLSILHAPWCGLELTDLTILAGDDHESTVIELIMDEARVAKLSESGRKRLMKLSETLKPALAQRGRIPLSQNVYSAWISLQGPVLIESSDNNDCENYFSLLNTLENEYSQITANILSAATQQRYSQTHDDAQVQLLTIHKAKGLEFDVVILPRLNSRSRYNDLDLLRWTRLPQQLLIAVLPPNEVIEDKFYRYLGILESRRQANELCRLLYVACTRARQKLHLYINLKLSNKNEIAKPDFNSLWKLLQPPLEQEVMEKLPSLESSTPDAEPEETIKCFRRLPENWSGIALPKNFGAGNTITQSDSVIGGPIEFSWAGETARISGIAIHHMLQTIEASHWQSWVESNTDTALEKSKPILQSHGLYGEQLDFGITNLRTAIENLKRDSRAEWIFSNAHQNVHAEWPLTGVIDNAIVSIIIDRSFVDESGILWIIDFKSSRHENLDKEQFLDSEQHRYSSQMTQYAHIVSMLEDLKIKLGLYFPLLNGWREWAAS